MTTIILKSGKKHHYWGNITISRSNGKYVVDDGYKVQTIPEKEVDRIIDDKLTP